MKILAAEIELREQTRETEQARAQWAEEEVTQRAAGLQSTQQSLVERTDKVIAAIIDLPDGEAQFAREIQQLTQASAAMSDAEGLLAERVTGQAAIAAETEAIEWLLQARRAGQGGGGGGGSDPGDGKRSGADLSSSALAQLGQSTEKNAAVVQRDVQQSTGKAGRELPDEFRHGLDRYFEVLEE